jgi:MarR-like DNA-binding transcriptional regulator SgrR of sgrS sRNA
VSAVEPAVPYDAAKLQQLQIEHAAFAQQLAKAQAASSVVERRAAVDEKLAALEAAADPDYAVVGHLLMEQQMLEQEAAQPPLSENEYLALAAQHTALLQGMQDMCSDLAKAKQYGPLRELATQLTALKAVDTSMLTPGTH